MRNFGEEPKPLEFDVDPFEVEEKHDEPSTDKSTDEVPTDEASSSSVQEPKAIVPPKQDEFLWAWKVCTLQI